MSPVAPTNPSPAALRALARRDPALGLAMRRLGPLAPQTQRGIRSHFHALARVIIHQQLAGAAAATIHARVRALAPGPGFPRPAALLELSERRLRAAGLSGNKLRALRDLAQHIVDGRLQLGRASRLSDAELIERLVAVRGIGEWSAQMFLMARLGRPDVLPTGDLGIQEGLRRLDRLPGRPTPREVEQRGACWSPLRSVASRYLWQLADERL